MVAWVGKTCQGHRSRCRSDIPEPWEEPGVYCTVPANKLKLEKKIAWLIFTTTSQLKDKPKAKINKYSTLKK